MVFSLKGKNVASKGPHTNAIGFPTNKMLDPDRDMEKEIIAAIKTACPIIARKLGEEKLNGIIKKRDYDDAKRITENLNSALVSLMENNQIYVLEQLIDQKVLEKFYESPTFKSEQLARVIERLADRHDFGYVLEKVVKTIIDNIHLNVLWQSLVDDLCRMDPIEATAYFLKNEVATYINKCDERIALFDEIRGRYGNDYIRIMSGGGAGTLCEGNSFLTTSNGVIYAPPYNATFDTKEENLDDYWISITHECGHHRWKTFRINLNPHVLHLSIIGAEYIGEQEGTYGKRTFLVKDKEGKIHEIKGYSDLMNVVKYPKLLEFLHNVADDKRIDALNMMDLPGLTEKYQENIDYLLMKRPKLSDEGLGVVLEGLLQVTVAGKTNSQPSEKIAKRLEKFQEILADMEIHQETDGTDSLNVALGWYVQLEPDLDELAKRVKIVDDELTKLLPKSFTGSETSIENNDNEIVNQDAGPIIISRKKGKRPRGPRGGYGINPISFLNKEDEKKEGGAYQEWTGNGYRNGSKVVIEKQVIHGEEISPPVHLVKKIERMFRKYVPKEGVLVRGLDSGEIDSELLEEYLSKVDAGQFPEPNYYCDVVYERSNAVFVTILDVSLSMSEKVGEKLKLTIASEGAAIITAAANLLKYPNETYAFTGDEIVEFFILPTSKYSITVQTEGIGNATPMAGAVRHATARTLELKKKHGKRFAYQFYICDGEPNSSGNGIDSVADTGKAIKEANAQNIYTFGIVIADEEKKQKLEDDYEKIFGPRKYVVTTDVEQIPDLLLGFLKRIIYNRWIG